MIVLYCLLFPDLEVHSEGAVIPEPLEQVGLDVKKRAMRLDGSAFPPEGLIKRSIMSQPLRVI
jgi:hypothetical protein